MRSKFRHKLGHKLEKATGWIFTPSFETLFFSFGESSSPFNPSIFRPLRDLIEEMTKSFDFGHCSIAMFSKIRICRPKKFYK